jgi:GTP-binding protein Era
MNDLTQPADNFEDDNILLDNDLPLDHRSGYVAVIGRPNVGKSTLLNHLLGQKIAIVSPKPQTTRNQIVGILTLDEPPQDCPPAQVIFVDTPGIHQPHHKFGQYLTETALTAIPDADVVVWLVDAAEPPTAEDQLVADALRQNKASTRRGHPVTPVILVLNKIDLLRPEKLTGLEQPFLALYSADEFIFISANTGEHCADLLARLIHRLPPGPRYYPDDQVTDQQTRFIAGELIREAALTVLHQEVPHALAVQVVEFKERGDNLTYISANLIVERDSHKKIVIGHKGQTLKQIGQLARPQIEELIETKVYLELWVKVRPKWRKSKNDLRWLGYTKP